MIFSAYTILGIETGTERINGFLIYFCFQHHMKVVFVQSHDVVFQRIIMIEVYFRYGNLTYITVTFSDAKP